MASVRSPIIEDGSWRLISRKQIVYLGSDGRSQFAELMRRRRQGVIYYAFDLLFSNGEDVICDPLGMPRKLLNQTRGVLFAQMPERILQLWQYDGAYREIFREERHRQRLARPIGLLTCIGGEGT